MTSDERKVQTKVGFFLFVGLVIASALIIYFGRLGEGARQYYRLNVIYSNASGLKKGADVLLSGARIGRVSNLPSILPDMQGVTVRLMIYNHIKIPKGARFTIGSSGLLGDRFVDIIIGKDVTKTPPIPPGSTIRGERETGIADIMATVNRVAEQASDLMTHLDTAVQDVDLVAKRVHNDLLRPDNLKSLATTLANLKTSSEHFTRASSQMSIAIGEGKKTFVTAGAAAEEIRKTAVDLHTIIRMSKEGKGTLGVLFSNQEMAENLRALVFNLRKHGVLWYKNTAP